MPKKETTNEENVSVESSTTSEATAVADEANDQREPTPAEVIAALNADKKPADDVFEFLGEPGGDAQVPPSTETATEETSSAKPPVQDAQATEPEEEPEAKAEPEPEPEGEPEGEELVLEPELVERAIRAGLSASEIVHFDSSVLERVVSTIESHTPQRQRQDVERPQARPEPEAAATSHDTDAAKLLKELRDEEFDPRVLSLIEKLDQEVAEQRRANEQIEQRRLAEGRARTRVELDATINALPEEWHSLLGRGDANDPALSEEAVTHRRILLKRMAEIELDRIEMELPPLSMRDNMEQALLSCFPTQAKNWLAGQEKEKLKKHGRRITARPTQRATVQGKATTKEELVRRVADVMREKGHDPGTVTTGDDIFC